MRGYTGRTFGFASRNFYVSFLAALEIDHNPEKYFGPLPKEAEAHFREVVLPAYVPVLALSRTLKIDSERLRELNPALLPPVWSGTQRVPKDYRLRLPLGPDAWTSELLAQRLGSAEMFAGQRGPRRYSREGRHPGECRGTLRRAGGRAGAGEPPARQRPPLPRARADAARARGPTLATAVAAAAAPAPAPSAPAAAQVAATLAPPSPGGAVAPDVAQRESAEDAAAAEAVRRAPHYSVTVEVLSAAQADAAQPGAGAGRRCRAERRSRPTTRSPGTTPSAWRPSRPWGTTRTGSAAMRSRLRALNHFSTRRGAHR